MRSMIVFAAAALARQEGASVVVSAVRSGSELRVGDVVLRYNGELFPRA
jgi:hypothetical protein